MDDPAIQKQVAEWVSEDHAELLMLCQYHGIKDSPTMFYELALVLARELYPEPISDKEPADCLCETSKLRPRTPASKQLHGEPSRAREIKNEQTQLSGETHELLPDARASGNESRVNPTLETLGEIDRAKVRRG